LLLFAKEENISGNIPMRAIIDAHMHLWDLDRLYYSWLQDTPLPNNPAGDVSPIAYKSYGLAEYRADVGDLPLTGCVHVECGLPAKDQLKETDWLQWLADNDALGLPNAIVAGAVLQDPEVGELLALHAQRRNVRGIRQIVNWHANPGKTYSARDMLRDDDWKRGFGLLRRHDLAFDLQIYPGQMADAARLAADHPDTRIILNHTGMPTDRDEAGLQTWRSGMQLLARRPNVVVKISGLAMVDRQWTVESFRPFVRQTIDWFGVDRCMFASNFPVEKIYGGFAKLYAAYDAITADLSDGERDRIFAGTARRIYKIV
jgi:predicted TIM-barrel fold metal-dependent hydrolase